jgi:hypothetical protein
MSGRGHLEQVSQYILLPGKGRETEGLLHHCVSCVYEPCIRWTWASGYGSIGVFIVVFVVVEVVANDNGSNKKVANTILCVFVRATRGRFLQGEQNRVGFLGTSRDTYNGYMVISTIYISSSAYSTKSNGFGLRVCTGNRKN